MSVLPKHNVNANKISQCMHVEDLCCMLKFLLHRPKIAQTNMFHLLMAICNACNTVTTVACQKCYTIKIKLS